MVGRIHRANLREVWKSEAKDFTPWLEENIDVLSDALEDLTLVSAEREKSAGTFSVDLIAEDADGNPVIIENQLEKSDHNHLGKIITYLTAVEAKAAIWIVSNPRPEHVRAISWLNESFAASFYLLKVEAVRIDDSDPAPLFTLIVGPSEESREAGETKKEIGERYVLREKFWAALLERAKKKTKLHARISPGKFNWIGTSAGKGLNLNYAVRQHEGDVELYIDAGKDSEEWNQKTLEKLHSSKQAIEKTFGMPLEWQRLEGKRACRIKYTVASGGYLDEGKWPEIHEEMIDRMISLEKALSPYISKLKS